jgi:hypothetical protein
VIDCLVNRQAVAVIDQPRQNRRNIHASRSGAAPRIVMIVTRVDAIE